MRGELLAVAVGGAIGAGARFGVTELFADGSARWGVLLVNAVGCLVIGVAATRLGSEGDPAHHRLERPLVMGGFCGGLTTLSAVALDAAQSLRSGATASDVGYLALMGCVAVGAVALGRMVGHRAPGERR